MSITKKLFYIFSFLILFSSIISAEDACLPNNDVNHTFNSTEVSYNVSPTLTDINSSSYYYFNADVPGTITLQFTSPAGKAEMGHSLSSCPVPFPDNTDPIIFNLTTSDLDFNLVVTATTADAAYEVDITFVPAPLTITKTVFPTQVEENNPTDVTYTIEVSNNTDDDLTNVIMTDILPFSLDEIIDEQNGPDGNWNCTYTEIGDETNLTCLINPLEAGPASTLDIKVTVDADSDIENTAFVRADDTSTFNSSAIIEVVDGSANVDLEIQKFASNDTIPPGTDFTYIIFVTNHAQGDADLVTVTDNFPLDHNVTFEGYDSSTGWTCTEPTDSDPTFTCLFDRSLGHEITYFTIDARTEDGNYTDTATNEAFVSALNDDFDGGHDLNDTATIIIGDTNITGGFYGVYSKGGDIEVSDLNFIDVNDNRENARLQTKVASTQGDSIPTYFVNSNNIVDTYSFGTLPASKTIPITVLLKLANDDCTLADITSLSHDEESRVVAIIEAGESMALAGNDPQGDVYDFDLRNIAIPEGRIIMEYIDINAELNTSGESCSVSNLSSNIKGLPQCLTNSAGSNNFDNNKYINVFGIDAFVRCAIQNGQPCDSSSGGYGDDPYDSEYGCYECTVGGVGYCSNDNFAIRPKAFYTDISDGDIYKAGKEYVFNFKGLTALDELTTDYNETQRTEDSNGTFYVDLNVSNNSECEVKSLKISPPVHFHDGVDDINHSFSDIGDINMSIHETEGTEFAKVDENDTTDVTQRLIEDFNVNFTVIPDHFDINATLADHNEDTDFTYLHDTHRYDADYNYSMSTTLTIDIKAMGENNITRNYTEECYAKNTTLTLDIIDSNITYPSSVPAITQFLYYNPLDDNESNDSGEGIYPLDGETDIVNKIITLTELPIENIPSTFPADPVDADGNGTTHIEYKLNFDRKLHLAVNPIRIALSDVNITDEDDVNGTTNTFVDANTTFYYARTRASKFFYEDINNTSVLTPIIIDVYCDLSFAECDALGIDSVSAQINEVDWWLSLGHRTSNNDGNITLKEGDISEGNSDNWSVSPNVNIPLNAIDENINVLRGTTNLILPLTVEIDLDTTNITDTNRWLIYNPETDDILQEYPTPLYKVRFIGTSGWAGHGDTGHVVESDSSIKKHRRLEW